MTELRYSNDSTMAAAMHTAFKRALENKGSLSITFLGDTEALYIMNLSSAYFYSNGFEIVTPERTFAAPYSAIKLVEATDSK